MPVFAYNLDTSLDDEIRKNYNPSKIEDDMALPKLPQNLREEETSTVPVRQYTPAYTTQARTAQPVKKPQYTSKVSVDGNYAVLKKGTKFRTKLVQSVSDKTHKRTDIALINQYPVSTTYLTVPMGAIFQGEIESSHPPQLSANGGLIKIKISSVNINGRDYTVEGFVTEANFRNIFFNNIKGERKYAKNLINSMRPGAYFYKRMFSTSARLVNDGGAAFWSPFPFAAGLIVLGGNIIISPILATFSKGGTVFLRSGSRIEIKLAKDAIIYE